MRVDLDKYQGSLPPWEAFKLAKGEENRIVGGVPVPWDMIMWRFSPITGSVAQVRQDINVKKKSRELFDRGFGRDKNISGQGENALHSSGSPILSYEQVERLYKRALDKKFSLKEAFVDLFGSDPNLRPAFLNQLAEAKAVYHQQVADEKNEAIGFGTMPADKEIAELQEKKRQLEMRENIQTLRSQVADLEKKALADRKKAETIPRSRKPAATA